MDPLLDLLTDLVAVDSTSRVGNLPVLDVIERVVGPHADLMARVPDDTGAKANLLVRIGPDAPGGVVLSAHTDCVPVDGQDWTSDPFTLTRAGDRVVGRGAVDMKGFIACCLDAVPTFAAAELDAPLWLAFSYDEELGALGARTLVPALAEHGARPDAVVVGEPTSLEPVTAHKGVRSFTFTFHGLGGHSSQPQHGANAVVAAARVAAHVADVAAEVVGDVDPAFDPPHTTFNVAQIRGGTAINIIPDLAEVSFEYRALPSEDGPELFERIERYAREVALPELQRTHPEASLEHHLPRRAAGARAGGGRRGRGLVRELTGRAGTPARAAPFGTDASHFQQAGWSTVVCGPGQIEVAHRPDEWIAVDQLVACRAMLDRLADRLRR